jgi:uncharacterized 2Fe-2S/4Fe-4S cluster protein (DUF4445 family)
MSVLVHINNHEKKVAKGSSLFEVADSMGIQMPTSCVKQGKCKECLVEITEGMDCLSKLAPQELHLSGKSSISRISNFRLSCRAKIIKDSGVIKCHTMRRGNMRVETKSVNLPGMLFDQKPDPAVRREGEKILLDGIEIDRNAGPVYGIALDLGTTTIVLRLIDLESGKIIADSSFENPQRFGGSDVMSRIHFDTTNKGKLLQRTLVGYLMHAIEEFPVDPNNIYEMVVAGNSTMRDLFFRLNVYSIGQNPYRSITEIEMNEGKRLTTSLTARPNSLHLPINKKARIYGLPIISGHVGADAAACLLVSDIAHEEKLVAIMDIGTNTELILGNKNKILAASCPAGPAFEGGNISCGMPGLPGAIEKVKINPDGTVELKVIGDTIPEGICGSGLIDILSELLKHKNINPLGRFENNESAFTLFSDDDTHIYINENDINELAQAKGANAAGLYCIFDNYRIHFNDIDTFYLAGGFGRYLNIDSSKRIGLIPNIPDSKIRQIGNASIEGASIALLFKTKRAELEKHVKNITHCRLETHPSFFDYFVEGCQFNPINSFNEIQYG